MSRSTLAALFACTLCFAAPLAAQDDAARETATGDSAEDAAADLAARSPQAMAWVLDEAAALADLVHTPLARAFLDATGELPVGHARTLQRDEQGRWLAPAEVTALDEPARAALRVYELDSTSFYTTKYGTPLAYVRPLELLGQQGLASLRGKRVLDIGSGTLGHLRLMALCGAEAVGVDVDPFLAALYAEPGDHGPLGDGSARLHIGRWPGDADTAAAVGAGFDLITAKNTLKRGYVHPAREVDPRMTIDLGVDDAAYLRALHDALEPGGLVMIFNICPAMAADDEPYIPWADGRSPWTREQWRAAGFELLAFDVVDDEPVREMARALGWDAQGIDPDSGLFTWYTLARRPAD